VNSFASRATIPAGLTRLASRVPWWSQLGPRIAIVAGDADHRAFLRRHAGAAVVVVATPLDVIAILECGDTLIVTVVLAEVYGSTTAAELGHFLRETYAVTVIASRSALP